MANYIPPPQLSPPAVPLLPLPRGTFAEEKRHPSRGGNPYSDDFRNDVIMRYQLGLALDTDELNALCAVYAYPSLSLCARYISKFDNLGHCCSMMKTGNHKAKRAVRGQSLVYLATFRWLIQLPQSTRLGHISIIWIRRVCRGGCGTGRASLGPKEEGVLNDVSEGIPPPE